MEPKEALDAIRQALAGVKETGQMTVNVEALERYLWDLEKDAGDSQEHRRMLHVNNLAHYAAQQQHSIETFKSVMDSGKEAINASLLINGGSAVAVLGFLGSMLSKGGTGVLGVRLAQPLLAFGLGVLSAAMAHGVRYCTQFAYNRQWKRTGHASNTFSVLLTTMAYVMFGLGLYVAYEAFTSYFRVLGS